METLCYIVYYAAHLAAGTASLLCCDLPMIWVCRLGVLTWGLSGVCIVLMVLDASGRYSLDRTWTAALAGGALPLTCGAAEKLVTDQELLAIPEADGPTVWTLFALLLLLQLWILLRGLLTPREDAPLAGAEELLERGCALGNALISWLGLFASGVMLFATFGLLLTIILGALLAERNALWEYIPGMLAGYGLCWVFQLLYFQRALALVRQEDDCLETEGLAFALLLPFWNTVQAQRLWTRLREHRGREKAGRLWL